MIENLLIVDPDAASQRATLEVLSAARYRTMVAETFAEALELLESARPDLLITVVRLGLFNGLQLVVRARSRHPRMAAIVVDDSRDVVLEQESWKLGAAAYLVKPVDSDELLRRVALALASRERRSWSRVLAFGNVQVRIPAGRARLVDISYGGCRLELRSALIPNVLWLDVPVLRLSVRAERVWSRRTDLDEPWSCGAALVAIDSNSAERWRGLVDKLRQERASFSSSPVES